MQLLTQEVHVEIAQQLELIPGPFSKVSECNENNYVKLSQVRIPWILISCINLGKLQHPIVVLISQLLRQETTNVLKGLLED